MSQPLILKITVDDKGNPALVSLNTNAKKLEKTLPSVGSMMKAIFATKAITSGIAFLRANITGLVSEIYKYELTLRKIEGITQTSGAPLKALGDTARQAALDTEFSATEVSAAMLEIVKAGRSVNETIELTPAILDLATAAGADLAWAAKNTNELMNAMGIGVEETTRVVDVMATSLNATLLNLEDFMEGMKYIAPIANNMGVSLEETAALLGKLTDAGIRGTMAGTTLRNIFLNLLTPSKRVAAALKDMNLEGKSVSDILVGLKKRGMTILDFLQTFDKRAVTGAAQLAEVGGAVNDLQKSLEDGDVAASDIANTIRDSTVIAWKIAKNTVTELGLSLADAFGDSTQGLIQSFTAQLRKLDTWIDNNHDTINGFVKGLTFTAKEIAGLVIPTLTALGKVIIATFALHAFRGLKLFMRDLEYLPIRAQYAAEGLKKMAMSMQAWQTVAMAAYIVLDRWATKLNELRDAQIENITKDWNTEGHLAALKTVKAAYDNLHDAEAAAQSLGMESTEWTKKATKELTATIKAHGNAWGDTSEKQVSTEESLDGMIRNLAVSLYLNKQNAEKTKETDENAKSLAKTLATVAAAADGDKKSTWFEDNKWQFDLLEAKSESEKLTKNWYQLGVDQVKNFEDGFTDTAKHWATNVAAMFNVDPSFAPISLEAAEENADGVRTVYSELFGWLIDLNKESADKIAAEQRAAFNSIAQSVGSITNSVIDIVGTYNQSILDSTLARLDAESAAITKRYDSEYAAAEGNAFKQTIIEEKRAQEEERIAKEKAAAEKEAKEDEKASKIAQATADATLAVIGVLANTYGGVYTRAAAGVAIAAIAAGYISQLYSALSGYRTGGIVGEKGNGTSDSNLALVSKGERILTEDNIDSLGGNERINQMLDRGGTYNTSSKTVHIDTFVGTREFARSMIKTIEKELSR